MCAVCKCVRAWTALSGINYSGPSWLQGNFLPVITADITGHSKFLQCHITDHFIFLCAKDPQFFKQQSPTVSNSCYSFTDLERMEA